jgi:hypothetical protein
MVPHMVAGSIGISTAGDCGYKCQFGVIDQANGAIVEL